MPGAPIRRARGGAPAPGARGYKWEPFVKGNTVALRHGAHSARKVDPLAAELVAGVLEDRPDLARHPEALMAWARAEVRCIILAEWQLEHGLVDEEGRVRGGPAVGTFERLASELRGRLGLDPRSEAELAKVTADAQHSSFSLDAILERGREALAARGDVTAEAAEVLSAEVVGADGGEEPDA